MKYYVIYYEELFDKSPISTSARFLCIVEHQEVAEDFCNKHSRCYYEEVIIGEN